MRGRHVVVLFQNRLFGEAIARALGENDQLKVTTLPVQMASAEALRAIHPDAIVLEEEPVANDIKNCLLDVAPVLTVVVGTEANTAEVYERHEVIQATATEITARIMAVSRLAGAKRPAAARNPSHVPREDER
jgi:ABC-type hemin transport system substrate-binding protein